MTTKNQYCIHIHNANCCFTALVNGIPAFNNPIGYAFNTNVPINHLLVNGTNTFQVIISPYDEQGCLDKFTKCMATILVKEKDHSLKQFIKIASNAYLEGTADIKENKQLASIQGVFQASLHHPDSRWASGQEIKLTEDNLGKITAKMRALYGLFAERKLSAIQQLIQYREAEVSESFFSTIEEGIKISTASFEEVFSNEDWVLQPLNLTEYIPMLVAGNKMVACLNRHFDSAIHYINKKQNLRKEFPFYFYLTHENKFEIIR